MGGARVSAEGSSAPVSVRLPGDIMQALRERAEADGITISDALRVGALMLLGVCPTCGQKAPRATQAATGEEDG
jgi:hypothetical protein